MLTRRKILITGTAAFFTAGASARTTVAENVHREKLTARQMTSATAAELCAKCAASCTALFDFSISRVSEGYTAFAETARLAADCGEICNVTALLLSRRGPMAPAICQACSDACERLAKFCSGLPRNSQTEQAYETAVQCAASCKRVVGEI